MVIQSSVKKFTIKVTTMDPIHVYTDDLRNGVGRIIIESWGKCWTAFWGAMGETDVKNFFMKATTDYLLEKLEPTKKDIKHLSKIIESIKSEFKGGEN